MPSTDPPDLLISPPTRLWTPWRLRYIAAGAREDGCVFCNRLAANNDIASLIVHRAKRGFVILNLFPYNTGHLMLVPNDHLASPEVTPTAVLAEMALLLRPTLRALRRALTCHGFNVGFNVGTVAGAGIADHLHQHVVPRWTGDANFMPILASTVVLPELLPVTYAKVRAEFERELAGRPGTASPNPSDSDAVPTDWEDLTDDPEVAAEDSIETQADPVKAVVLSPNLDRLLVTAGDPARLPSAVAAPDEPVWQAARRAAGDVIAGLDLAGWAGQSRAVISGPVALTFLVREVDPGPAASGGQRWIDVTRIDQDLSSSFDRAAVRQALANLPPVIAPP